MDFYNNKVLIDAMEEDGRIKYRYYKWVKMTNEEGLKVLKDHLERVKNGSCEGRPNVRNKIVHITPILYCDDWEDIKSYDDYLEEQNKSAIIITKFMRYTYKWNKDYKKSYLNWSIKTSIKDFKEEFGCDIDAIKDLKVHHKKMMFNITRFAKEVDEQNKSLKKIYSELTKDYRREQQKLKKWRTDWAELKEQNKELKDALAKHTI